MPKSSYPYDVVVSDTSSLSNFVNIGKIDILHKLYNSVAVTTQILSEYKKIF